jgi:TetR/AcrR family transcriptional repressor of nem operon
MTTLTPPDRKQKLIEAAIHLIRERGYTGTTVDLICAEAGVTKGSFFHYFTSKEDIGEAALNAWMGRWFQGLDSMKFEEIQDPLDRVNALFDLMTMAYLHPDTLNGCLVGTVAQELAPVNRRLGDICERHLNSWLEHTTKLLEDAKRARATTRDFDPRSLAMHMMSIVQGSLLVAKTMRDSDIAANSIAHSRAYVNSFFV